MRRALLIFLLLCIPSLVSAQSLSGDSVTIGGSRETPTGTSVRLNGLATSGTSAGLLFGESDGDVFTRLLTKNDQVASTAYLDETENVLSLWNFSAGLTGTTGSFSSTLGVTGLSTLTGGFSSGAASSVAGNLTITSSNDLIIGTGGIRAGSGASLIRNVADSATIASFGDAAIALNQPTTQTGHFTVTSGDIIAPEIRAASGSFLIRNVADSGTTATFGDSSISLARNTSVTGTFSVSSTSSFTGDATFAADISVNGGDINSTASNLNINSGSTISLLDDVVIGASKIVRTSNFTSRTTGWGITYAGEADFRYTYADEFYTKNFIADLETAINGGQIIAKSTVVLAVDFTCPAAGGTATLRVRDFPGHTNMRVFAASDWVVLRSMTRADSDADGNIEFSVGDCVGQVTSYADQSDDTQTWTFTRGSGGNAGAMAASTVVAADSLVIDFGVSGQGFLVARANDGTEGSQSPYWQTVTWTTSPVAANMTLRTRWGQLNGSYGYSSSTYGFAAGNPADVFVAVDDTNGFRAMENGTTQRFQIHPSGYALVGATSNRNIYIGDSSINLRDGVNNRVLIDPTGLQMYDNANARRVLIDSTGYLLFGQSGSGQFNTYISDSQITLRTGTTDLVTATTSGGNPLVRVGRFTTAGDTYAEMLGGIFRVGRFGDSDYRVHLDSTTARFGSTGGARVQVDYTGTPLVRMYDGVGKQFFQIDQGNGLLLGDWYTANASFLQLWPDGSQIVFCRNGGSSCPLQFSGTTGDINSYGNINLQSGGRVASSGNFTLGNAEGLRLERWASTSVSEPRSITFYNSGALSALIGQDSNGAVRINSRTSGANTGIRLQLGAYSAGSVEPGLFITNEVSGSTNILNAVLQSAASAAFNPTEIRFVPLHGSLGGGTASYLGTATYAWSHIYGSQYYSNGSAGWTGSMFIVGYGGATCQANYSGGLLISHNCPTTFP